MPAINGIDADTNREIILKLLDLFDPWMRCAEPDCFTSISFKTHWSSHVIHDEASLIMPDVANREAALDWWRGRQTIPWYCSQHDKA